DPRCGGRPPAHLHPADARHVGRQRSCRRDREQAVDRAFERDLGAVDRDRNPGRVDERTAVELFGDIVADLSWGARYNNATYRLSAAWPTGRRRRPLLW